MKPGVLQAAVVVSSLFLAASACREVVAPRRKRGLMGAAPALPSSSSVETSTQVEQRQLTRKIRTQAAQR